MKASIWVNYYLRLKLSNTFDWVNVIFGVAQTSDNPSYLRPAQNVTLLHMWLQLQAADVVFDCCSVIIVTGVSFMNHENTFSSVCELSLSSIQQVADTSSSFTVGVLSNVSESWPENIEESDVSLSIFKIMITSLHKFECMNV